MKVFNGDFDEVDGDMACEGCFKAVVASSNGLINAKIMDKLHKMTDEK